ncbi:MAG: SDR family oxidoreductase, partial [Chloroflexi bacterium]|nr:SDR family oxidoreductase [Chloroflexota bacterium]
GALESLGAEVTRYHCSLDDPAQIAAYIGETLARTGTIHGVIYTVGGAGPQIFAPVQDLSSEECRQIVATSTQGLQALDQALHNVSLDFGLIVSSLATVLGGRGYAAYAAAHLTLDALAQEIAQTQPGRWLSVGWDAWAIPEDTTRLSSVSADHNQFTLTADEGLVVFRRALSARMAQRLVVSTGDLANRIAQDAERISVLRAQLQPGSSGESRVLHPRPQLQTEYAAPRNEIEQALAEIWQRALGFEQIGIHDNFFELGGDSFIAIQVMAGLKKQLNVELSAVKLYQTLTIKALAEVLSQDEAAQQQKRNEKLDDLRQQMSQRRQYQQQRRARR